MGNGDPPPGATIRLGDAGAPRHSAASAGSEFGDYVLLERLGRGGMGEVWRARQRSLARDVAIKFVAGPDDAGSRFRDEARHAARIQHPNIVEIYDFGRHAGQDFYSMRLIDGRSLHERLRDEGPLAATEAARMLRTVAEAIDYAHRLGVLHLDLKPANLLLTTAGEPLIADFGLARTVDDGEHREVAGTPGYMAPEQASRGRLDARTDVYALGAVLYHALCGRPPHVDTDTGRLLAAIVDAPPPPMSTRRRPVPADLEAICRRCLAKAPAERYASAREFADDLQRYLEGHVVSARPLGPLARGARWARRERGLASAVVFAFAALAVGTIVSTWQWRQTEAQRAEADAQRRAALAASAEMSMAVDLGVHLLTGGSQSTDAGELRRRASDAVARLREATGRDEALLARVLGAFTGGLARVKGEEGAQAIIQPVVETFGAPWRAQVARAWDARATAEADVIAALWSRPAGADVESYWRGAEGAPRVLPMGGFADRLRRAHARDPDDPLPLFVAALYCDPRADACAIPDAALRLARLEPDNAANWVLAADRAQTDAAGVRDFLRHAARAARFDDRFSALFALYRRGLDESGVPLPETMRVPLAAASGNDRPEFLPMYWEFQLRPVFPQGPFVALCSDRVAVAGDDALRADCVAYFTKAFESRGGLLHNVVAATMLRRLLPDTPTAARMVAHRRQYLWMRERPDVMQVVADRGGSWEKLMRDAERHGEFEGYVRRTVGLGHAAEPPAGWLPSDPDDLLLPEDRPQAGASDR